MQAAIRLEGACNLAGVSAHLVASIEGFVHASTVHTKQAHVLASVHVEVYLLQTNLMQPVASATHHAVNLLEAAILDFPPDQTFLA